MSDTPTFASLLTQWTGGGPAARAGVYAHLRAHPAEAAAVEGFIRDDLTNGYPLRRVIAAEAMAAVYQDEDAAAAALGGVLRTGDPSAAAQAVPVMRTLAPARAGRLLGELALHAPAVFRDLSATDHRWAGAAAAAAGPDVWLSVFARAGAEAESAFLTGLAAALPRADRDLSAVEPAVRVRLFHTGPGYAAGAALWRLTWRVHRDWLASIDPNGPQLQDGPLLALLVEVLTEHLGRRPDLAPLVRALLVRLGTDPERFKPALERLANLGGRGWAVLLPILGDAVVGGLVRAAVFRRVVKCAAVWPLAHYHAHNVIRARIHDRAAVPDELLDAAGMVLYSLGRAASSATPDVLDLIVLQPDTAVALAKVVAFTVSGLPDPVAAVARTLDRLGRSVPFAPAAFAVLAKVYAWLDLDGAVGLVDDTTFDAAHARPAAATGAVEGRPAGGPAEHALALADRLGSPRAAVRRGPPTRSATTPTNCRRCGRRSSRSWPTATRQQQRLRCRGSGTSPRSRTR